MNTTHEQPRPGPAPEAVTLAEVITWHDDQYGNDGTGKLLLAIVERVLAERAKAKGVQS